MTAARDAALRDLIADLDDVGSVFRDAALLMLAHCSARGASWGDDERAICLRMHAASQSVDTAIDLLADLRWERR
jgi:hypothetical protein